MALLITSIEFVKLVECDILHNFWILKFFDSLDYSNQGLKGLGGEPSPIGRYGTVVSQQNFSKTALTIFFIFCTKVPYYYGKNRV